ncbi:MAG: Uma2 family endonuclease [Microcoleus sp. SU_5_6]|nr:Uma2 family endonuclease [Microcoleus sp. SU_5_6]NJL67025.1 Uma2 family endonuclease [Microcoleus sp. SM1_3_4]
MVQARKQKLTFEEYLAYEDNTDNRYELIDGELVTLPPESEPNNFIAYYLLLILANGGFLTPRLIRIHSCELQVPILHGDDAANRYPDLVILQPEHILLTASRLTITLDMPPPQLVVEVVSPGRIGRERDYIRKRAQYAARGIPEYWIVDPQEQLIVIFRLESGQYVEVGIFQGTQAMQSPTFPQLNLTAGQVLAGEF